MQNDSDSSSSSGLFSPVHGRRSSLHEFTPTPSATADSLSSGPLPSSTPLQTSIAATSLSPSNNDALPRLQDNSWIGARVSPIASQDDDDQDYDDDDAEDIAIMAPYHKAMKETSFLGANEETTLLGRRMVTNKHGARMMGFHSNESAERQNQPRSRNQGSNHPKFALPQGHPTPLVDVTGGDTVHGTSNGRWYTSILMACCRVPRRYFLRRSSLIVVPVMSGLFLFCIALHDAFLAYLSLRRGVTSTYSLAWSVPWMGPSARSMLRFGAFSPEHWLESQEYWRSLTAMVATSSLSEWGLILLAWRWGLPKAFPSTAHGQQYSPQQTVVSSTPNCLLWPVVSALSALTGQLWMLAFTMNTANADGVSGCSGWGTAGVLCAMGMLWPEGRFGLFLMAIALVLVNLVQAQSFSSSTGSIFGIIGASFFGWSWCGMWLPPTSSSWEQQQPHSVFDDDNSYDSKKHDSGLRGLNQYSNNQWGFWNVISAFVVVSLWLFPVLYMCYG
jgi:hypothetical protein